MRRTLFVFLFTTMLACTAKAAHSPFAIQRSDSTKARYSEELAPRFAFTQGWRSMLDVSIALRIQRNMKWPFNSYSFAAGAEWNYGFRKPLLGYKIGYTFMHQVFDFSGYSAGINAVYFTDHKSGGWYAQPQFAYEILDMMEIMVQYNVPLTHSEIDYRVNSFSAGLRFWVL